MRMMANEFALAQSLNTITQSTMKSQTEPSTLTSATFEDLVQEMLVRLGEDPNREGLQRTPERVHKSMKFLTPRLHRRRRSSAQRRTLLGQLR